MPVDELEEQLRRGRLPDSVHIQHPAWTGDGFLPAREIPALKEALSAEEARMCAQLRRFGVPWLTVALCAVLVVVGVGQGVATVAGYGERVLDFSAVGFEKTVMERAFWTPFTAALAHVGFGHLGVNLPLLAYCGYRSERVLGAIGVAAVYALALFGSTVAILLWSDLPVVGASTLVYGVWGAQIALGFRHGNLIPAELQGRYGVGNLVLFLPLAFMSLFDGPGISLVGHAGGLVGGVVAAAVSQPFALGRAQLLTFAGLFWTALLPFSPASWWAGSWSTVAVSEGISVSLPERWIEHAGRWEGMHAWSSGDEYAVFAGTFVVEAPEDEPAGTAEEPAAREQALWGEWLQTPAAAKALPDDPAIFEVTSELDGAGGEDTSLVIVERVVERDGLRTRVGYRLPRACKAVDACPGRRAIGDAVLASLAWTGPGGG